MHHLFQPLRGINMKQDHIIEVSFDPHYILFHLIDPILLVIPLCVRHFQIKKINHFKKLNIKDLDFVQLC